MTSLASAEPFPPTFNGNEPVCIATTEPYLLHHAGEVIEAGHLDWAVSILTSSEMENIRDYFPDRVAGLEEKCRAAKIREAEAGRGSQIDPNHYLTAFRAHCLDRHKRRAKAIAAWEHLPSEGPERLYYILANCMMPPL